MLFVLVFELYSHFRNIARAKDQIKYFACMADCVVTVLDSEIKRKTDGVRKSE